MFPAESLGKQSIHFSGNYSSIPEFFLYSLFLSRDSCCLFTFDFRILITVWKIISMLRVISSPLFHFPICKTKIMVLAPGVQCSEFIDKNTVEKLDTVMLTT